MTDGIDELANGVGKAIETVPELYDDGLKPATKESGKTLALIPRAINAALEPLQIWILKKEYNIERTKKLLEEKLKNVSPEKIVPPEPYVAVPAMQAIAYSMDNEELRNMYASLLAKAMNNETKEYVHPSFVDIIKQMSPSDAKIFKEIMNNIITPLISLSTINEKGGKNNFIYNLSWMTNYGPDIVRLSLDNLIRLGLISIPYGTSYTNDKCYVNVRNTEAYKNAKHSLELLHKGRVEEDLAYIKKTELAKSFYKICIS